MQDNNKFIRRKEQLIQQKLVGIIRQHFSGTALEKLTITRVELDRSSELAKIFYLPFQKSAGNLEFKISLKLNELSNRMYRSLGFKKPIKLKFLYDRGLEHSFKIDRIINDLAVIKK